jgi:cytoskeletal protein CcmA (bactofilin family)
MWRKQEEPKSSSSPREANAGPVGVSWNEPPSPAAPVITPVITRTLSAATSATAAVPEPPTAVTRLPAASTGNVSATLIIKGEITGREDLFIDGDVQGKIRIEGGRVTVGCNGRVTADIEAREITIQGNVRGNLLGQERVQIGPTGCARGNVFTRRIFIEDGAEVHGTVEITPGESSDRRSQSSHTKSPEVLAKVAEPVPVGSRESPTVA